MKKIICFAVATLAVLAAALTLTTSCQKSEKKAIAKHVIIIGLDGWGSYSMDSAQVPNIRQYMSEGCYTLFKRTIRPSVSGPNWAAQMNGTPLESSGITNNDNKPSFKPLFLTEHNAQPTFFHLMRQQYPEAETGVVCEWGDFLNYADTLCLSYFKRIDKIEEIAKSKQGVKSAYAMQAGHELRVIIDPDKLGDNETMILAREISSEIEANLKYPGLIRVVAIRERRCIEYAR